MPDEGFDFAGFVVTTLLTGGFYDPYTLGAYDAIKSLGSAGISGSCSSDNNCKHAFGPWLNSEGYYAGRIKALFYADWFNIGRPLFIRVVFRLFRRMYGA